MLSNDTIMKPPYEITMRALGLVAAISEKLGEVKAAHLVKPPAELRRKNRIKTIHSSLEIEGNTLTIEQITAIVEGKRVLAPAKDILEVKNAIKVYDSLADFKPYSLESILAAHKILMSGLVERAGTIRNSAVGVFNGNEVVHLAPPADMVRPHLNDLLKYLKTDEDLLLIKSCVFHYEFEFIHPFVDGNGRMGRLWQTVILREYNPVFEFLPVETLIKTRQQEYYNALGSSDSQGKSTLFIEFMLSVINDSLEELLRGQNVALTAVDRIEIFGRRVVDDGNIAESGAVHRRHHGVGLPDQRDDIAREGGKGFAVQCCFGKVTVDIFVAVHANGLAVPAAALVHHLPFSFAD